MSHESRRSASLSSAPLVFAYQKLAQLTNWARRTAATALGIAATAVTFVYAAAERYPEMKPARNAMSQLVVTVLEKVKVHTGFEIPADAIKSSLKTQ